MWFIYLLILSLFSYPLIYTSPLVVRVLRQKCILLCCLLTLFFYLYPQGDKQAKKHFDISWLRVRMSYHRFNNLAELLNGDIGAKIGQGIFFKYLMDIAFNCSLPSKVNRKCVYKGKCRSEYIIYKIKCSICDAIYMGNTQQTFKNKNRWSII